MLQSRPSRWPWGAPIHHDNTFRNESTPKVSMLPARPEPGKAFAWCILRPQPDHLWRTNVQHHPLTQRQQRHSGPPWPSSSNCHDQSTEQAPHWRSMPRHHPPPLRLTPPHACLLPAGGLCRQPTPYAAISTMGAVVLMCKGPTRDTLTTRYQTPPPCHRCRLAAHCYRGGHQICGELTTMAQIYHRQRWGCHLRHGATRP
jgi:hypothetical protein